MNAVANHRPIEASDEVRATLNYTRNTGVRPVNYTFDPPAGLPRSSGEVDSRLVTIHDARAVSGLSSFATQALSNSATFSPATWSTETGWEKPTLWPSIHVIAGTGIRGRRRPKLPS